MAATATGTPLSFRQVSAGDGSSSGHSHVCGTTTDNRAYCWGMNERGQLGVGNFTGPEFCGFPCSTRPVAVHGGHRFIQVSAGGDFTCGITTDRRAYCWGGNADGQLGDGTRTQRPGPVPIASSRRFRAIAAGRNHACAITNADAAFCWGMGFEGQLGDGSGVARLVPVRVAGGHSWKDLSAGHTHTCGATTTNLAYCWGSNGGGKLGDGSPSVTNRLRPSPVAGNLPFRHVSAGFTHTCAVTTEHRAYCWGDGPLGDGTFERRTTPTAVLGNRKYDQLSTGLSYTCGATRAGRGFCWGSNSFAGQLGDGTTETRVTATAISGNLALVQVSGRYLLGCGVAADHRAYCWGDNGVGQLGNGTQVGSRVPVPVAPPL